MRKREVNILDNQNHDYSKDPAPEGSVKIGPGTYVAIKSSSIHDPSRRTKANEVPEPPTESNYDLRPIARFTFWVVGAIFLLFGKTLGAIAMAFGFAGFAEICFKKK
ncbi:MAG TPA: hypothetical protein P5056_02705 [Candidatus Paceibacterota bacterium]|nr:hypothetical protein [Candidatus Paceibacterota bacterium]